MKIIVLSIAPYKEKDGIISAISEEGAMTLTARGIMDPKNKNAALNNPLTIAEVEIGSERFKYPLVKNSSVLVSPMKLNNDYYYLGSIAFLNEVSKKLLQDEEKVMMYKHLYAAICALKEVKDPWMIDLIYLCNVFKATGYEFQVDECVFCGSRKNISTFSFKDGGFVCGNCVEKDTERPFSSEQMLLLREAYFASDYSKYSLYCTKENALAILRKFNEFINESFGATISAINFLDK